ncbi:hypothetical protein K227x_63500 [Rubripirellula lacrimiformis]|uniref:Glycosyl transferase family 11 n=1 Tax=Rubripirellula lacrimiformis TaxID=1930273 RepID=A0A517NLB8_9BACT|nr:hypothetical protein [Rubripirellula lacrimiformis]QDT07921.1 hypothetical protein K227x_63500 [Rubripirellula lacrimiformis]
MIVIARNYGQLGNRLMLSANLIAAACELDVPLRNPSFSQYASYFTSTANDLWCRFPSRSDDATTTAPPRPIARQALYRSVYLTGRTLAHLRMTRLPFHLIRMTGERKFDLQSAEFASMARSGRPVLVSGWHFHAGSWLHKHADVIRDFYRIRPDHQRNVDELVGRARSTSDILVGVHVRGGDYATFKNGRYFYSIPKYVAAMKRIRDRFSGAKVTFLVCGNVPLVQEDFGDLDVHFGTGQMVEDMYSFAAADLLIGPPSTFTGWASFYGQIPLWAMNSADEPFDAVRLPPGSRLNQIMNPVAGDGIAAA